MVRQFAFCRWTAVRSEQFSADNVTVKRRECGKSRQFIRGGMDRLSELVHDVHAGAAPAEKELDLFAERPCSDTDMLSIRLAKNAGAWFDQKAPSGSSKACCKLGVAVLG